MLVMTNDEMVNFTRMDVIDSKGLLTNYQLFTINDSGRVTKFSGYLPKNDTIQGQQIYAYNAHGFCEPFKVIGKNNKLVVTLTGTLTYDDKGNWIRAVWSKNGRPWEIDE